MDSLDRFQIIRQAWEEFDDRNKIKGIFDVSAHVSTNQVYKVSFYDRKPVFAKISDYGKFENFREDHIIVNNLSNNLEEPYENFLANSLVKRNEMFTYRYYYRGHPTWVVFYNPIKIGKKLPKILDRKQIKIMGRELALFHKACYNVQNQLPLASKNIVTDIRQLIKNVHDSKLKISQKHQDIVLRQCDIFLKNIDRLNYLTDIQRIPVFVDWNIGNFSLTPEGKFLSRWDYDWFRESSRVMDFYFFSRVVSESGDRTVFSYIIDPLMGDRFILFLKEYHKVYPLSIEEVKLIPEAYRFFILNYVIKDGSFFFRENYAKKLQKEAYDVYFPTIETNYKEDKLLKALKL